MMTSSNGNIFRVTGPLWEESTGHDWIPLTMASDTERWCFLWSAPEQTIKQTIETQVIWDAIALTMTSILIHIISPTHPAEMEINFSFQLIALTMYSLTGCRLFFKSCFFWLRRNQWGDHELKWNRLLNTDVNNIKELPEIRASSMIPVSTKDISRDLFG